MCSSKETESAPSGTGQAPAAKEISDQLYAAYLKQRRYLIDSECEAAKTYDKWLLTLSGGALALSMTFIKDVVSPNGVDGPGWLLAAWLFLVLAIALGLICIYVSQKAHGEFREYLDETLEAFQTKSDHAGFWAAVRAKEEKSWRAWWVGTLNFLSGAAFVVGIASLSYFACMNVPQRSSKPMAENTNESAENAAPVEQPMLLPGQPKILHGDRLDVPVVRAMAPPTGPVDQAAQPTPKESQQPIEQPAKVPAERIVPCSAPPLELGEPAMKPAPGPIDQVPAPKLQEPAEDK